MNTISRGSAIQQFSQSLSNMHVPKSEYAALTVDRSVQENAVPKYDLSNSFLSGNNVKVTIGQSLVQNEEQIPAAPTCEIKVDESYRETLCPMMFFIGEKPRDVFTAMPKNSTTERPEVYLEIRENGEKKAYLIDLNQIDPSNMTRMEGLALVYRLSKRDDIHAYATTVTDSDNSTVTAIPRILDRCRTCKTY